MNQKTLLTTFGVAIVLMTSVWAVAADPLETTVTTRDDSRFESAVASTLESAESTSEQLQACLAEEEEEAPDEGPPPNRTAQNETDEEAPPEKPQCPDEELKEEIKEELDETLPSISYCKRINGRITCVGFNDNDICAVFFMYDFPICLGLWKSL